MSTRISSKRGNRHALTLVAVLIGVMGVKFPFGLLAEMVTLFMAAAIVGLKGLRSTDWLNSRLFHGRRDNAWMIMSIGLAGLASLGWLVVLHLYVPLTPR